MPNNPPIPAAAVEIVRRIRERNEGRHAQSRLDYDLIDWIEREPDRVAALPHLAAPAGDVLKCPDCNGSGKMPRPMPFGRGRIFNKCKACGGSGKWPADASAINPGIPSPAREEIAAMMRAVGDDTAKWLADNEAVFEEVRAEREFFRDRVTKAEAERDEAQRSLDAQAKLKWEAYDANKALIAERDALAERLAASERMTASAQRIIDRLEAEAEAMAERLRVVEAELAGKSP